MSGSNLVQKKKLLVRLQIVLVIHVEKCETMTHWDRHMNITPREG